MTAMDIPPAPSYAGFWRRYGAVAIDELLLVIPEFIFESSDLVKDSPLGATLISVAIGWVYFALMHSSRWQATLGKRAFGIKVTDLAGNRIGLGRATGRYFATLISTVLLFMGYLVAAFTKRR